MDERGGGGAAGRRPLPRAGVPATMIDVYPPSSLSMHLRRSVVPVVASLCAGLCQAQVSPSDLDLRVTPDDLQPSVTVKEYDNRTVEDYSVNHNTYMMKITPSAGAPYYLVDEDGSGDMTWRRGGPDLTNNVPQWTLLSW